MPLYWFLLLLIVQNGLFCCAQAVTVIRGGSLQNEKPEKQSHSFADNANSYLHFSRSHQTVFANLFAQQAALCISKQFSGEKDTALSGCKCVAKKFKYNRNGQANSFCFYGV